MGWTACPIPSRLCAGRRCFHDRTWEYRQAGRCAASLNLQSSDLVYAPPMETLALKLEPNIGRRAPMALF